MIKKLTVPALLRRAPDAPPLVALTAYDSCFGALADAAGVDLILVGDSVGMTMLGHESTLPVTLEQMLHHTAAVVRGVQRALVVGDMPFLSYQVGDDEAVRNAGRFLQEAGADAVKLEGGKAFAPTIRRMTQAGIPVMGHIGLLPQHVKASGYAKHGRSEDDCKRLLADAAAIVDAGVFSFVIEGTDAETATRITQSVSVPTIGIGSGGGCTGEIQVMHDILGLLDHIRPSHAHRYIELGAVVRDAIGQYAADVRNGSYPAWE